MTKTIFFSRRQQSVPRKLAKTIAGKLCLMTIAALCLISLPLSETVSPSASAEATAASGPWDDVSDQAWARLGGSAVVKMVLENSSLEHLTAAADAGNSNAAVILGAAYLGTEGITPDTAASARYFRTGCESGNVWGCYYLGSMHEIGLEVPRDYDRARELHTRTCDAGNILSCYSLGALYQSGLGAAPDYVAARQAYTRACNRGHASACYSLGTFYEAGLGIQPDDKRASELYARACNGGLETACAN